MKTKAPYYFIVLLLTCIISCRKNEDIAIPSPPQQQQNCKIITLAYGADYYSFAYDDQGRLAKRTENSQPGNYDSYTYSDGSYEKQTKKNNQLYKKTTALLNTQGWVKRDTIREYGNNGTIVIQTTVNTYEYTSDGEMTKSIAKVGNNPEQTISYTWSNGNLVGDSRGYTYTYYTGMPGQDGNFLGVVDLMTSDISRKQSKNLLKSLSIQGITTPVSYQFDSDGKIILIKYGNGFVVVEHACY